MIWDSTLTAAVARELDRRLSGARLSAHRFDWDRRELTLYFREDTLRWSLHPKRGWLTLTAAEPPPSDTRALAAELVRVEAPPDERVVRLLFRKTRGRTRRIQIVVELITTQWNALLLEGDEGWIRHLLWTRPSESRPLVVGQTESTATGHLGRAVGIRSGEPRTVFSWHPQDMAPRRLCG